ncbi:MAG: glycoside hydrolase [Rikenellaceae bacterium]|nr:glycoside hydrolase [Rikenellaceae bacterium]
MRNLPILLFLYCFTGLSAQDSPEYNLPYKNTYVKEPLVTDNPYRGALPVETPVPELDAVRMYIPAPVWDGHSAEIQMYWRAWEIAFRNICHPQPGSGFVSTYIDTAYNGNIFMWDTSFISMFARYGWRAFPFQQTLDNFYAKQHPDGFICREIQADGADCFERYDPVSTGPNLLPWSEVLYYRHTGDLERLHKVFPALCAYYKWLGLNRTWPDGTYWSSGWGTGMDNMPRVQSGYNPIFSHGHMVWLDTNLQQIFVAGLLLEIGFHTERWQEIEDFEEEAKMLSKYVENHLWDETTGFLHDRYADGSLCPTKGIGAFWALHTDVLDKERTDRLVAHLSDTAEFARPYPVPSLSADHPKYNVRGRYWQGGVWAPTNYMIIDGLRKKGYGDRAYDIASRWYGQVLEVYREKGTFYEYYSPELCEEGFLARDEFVGWTGLAPVSILLEYLIGITSDYSNRIVEWDIRQRERHGVENYMFGPQGSFSMIAAERSDPSQPVRIEVNSDSAFTLHVRRGATAKKIGIEPGIHRYEI